MQFIKNWIERWKTQRWLKAGETRYKNLSKSYRREITDKELHAYTPEQILNLREAYIDSLGNTLGNNIFFAADGTAYTIINNYRYNLDTKIYNVDYWSGKQLKEIRTLAEVILPRGTVIITPLRKALSSTDTLQVVAINTARQIEEPWTFPKRATYG